ncbi:MAG: hypothetical protein M1839_001964 [Geoglossum umbratile]|nr:MAG: hypothetical protein M1839_001964 [Geoglossum umbratile]
MATKPATLEWLDKHIFSELSGLGVDPATLSQVRARAELLPKTLPAGSLEVDDSLLIFGLSYDPRYKAWSLEHHERYEIPPLLSTIPYSTSQLISVYPALNQNHVFLLTYVAFNN